MKTVKAAIIGAVIAVVFTYLTIITGGTATPFLAGLISNVYLASAVGGAIIGAASSLLAPKAFLGDVRARARVSVDIDSLMKWAIGETALATDAVWVGQHGNDQQFYSFVIAGAGHLIDSFGNLYVDGDLISFSGAAAQGDWLDVFWRQTRIGTTSQTSLPNIDADDVWAGIWPSTATGKDMAYYRLRWDTGQDKISSGVPTRITQVAKGGPVYDPRLDSTRGGSGTHRADDQTTWEYNDGTTDIGANWALVVLRYLLGWQINGKLAIGMGIDPDDIDIDQAMAAANVCETTIDGIPRYRIGGILSVSNDHAGTIGQLEAAINGKVAVVAGKYYIWAPNNDLTVFSRIDEVDILRDAGVNYTPAGPMEDLYNTARGQYIDKASTNLYQPKPYPEIEESTAVTEDGGVRLIDIDFSLVQDRAIAERVARQYVRRSRFSATWRFAMGPKGLTFQPFTVTYLNCQETNDVDVLVRIVNMSYSVSGAVVMEMIEEDASIYDTTLPLGTSMVSTPITSTDPTTPIALNGLTATPISVQGDSATATDGFLVTWTDPGSFVLKTHVQFKQASTSSWIDVPPARADATQALIYPVEPGTLYDIRARHITLLEIVGAWVAIQATSLSTTTTGSTIFIGTAYLRKATAPTTPVTDDGAYNFSTLTLTAPSVAGGSADNWSTTIPGGTDPVYVTYGTFQVTGSTGTDSTVTWSAPVVLVQDGAAGTNSRGVNLTIADQVFEYDTDGANPSPANAVLTATPLNTSGSVYYEFFLNNVSKQNTLTATYTYTPPVAYSSLPDTLEVQIREGASTGPILARDQLTVSGLQAGVDAITVIVSNEAHALPTTNSGIITYTGSGTDINVWDGTAKVPYGSATPGFTVSAAGTDITPDASPSIIATYTRRYGIHSAMTADTASIVYTVTVKNAAGVISVFTKTQSFAKSFEGADGATGATGTPGTDGVDGLSVTIVNAYKRAASTPATPTVNDGSYNFSTKVLTPPTGWSAVPPAGSNPLYVTTGTFSIVGTTGTDTTVTWTAPNQLVSDGATGATGAAGGDGDSVYVANAYKRASSAPATPTVDDGSYNFGTKTLTPPTGWATVPPAGSNPLYVTTGSFSINGITGIDTTVTWTGPNLLVSDGATGATGPQGVPGADGADGAAGVDSRGVNLTVDSQVITYDTEGANPSPSSATLTATPLNTTGTVYYEFFVNDVTKQNTTAATYAYTSPAAFSSLPDKVEVQIREGSSSGTILARDQLTISGLQAGSDGITVALSNSAHVLPTTSADVVTYTGSGTDINVWEGITQVPYSSSLAPSPSFKVSRSATNISPGSASTVSTYTRRYADHSNMSADYAFINFTITVKNSAGIQSIFVMKQSLAKSIGGDAGISSQLTNPSVIVPAASDGTGYSLTGTGGTHQVIEGGVDVTTSATHSISGTSTKNGLTISVVAGTGVYSLSGASWTSDSESFTLRAIYGGVTMDKIYNITKAKAGTAGGGGSTKAALVGGLVFHFQISPANAAAEWGCFNDGNEKRKIGTGSYTTLGAWLLSGAVGDYEIKGTLISGVTPLGTSLGSWLVLSTSRTWAVVETTNGVAETTSTFYAQIRETSTGFVQAADSVTITAAVN